MQLLFARRTDIQYQSSSQWKKECTEASEAWSQKGDLQKLQRLQVKLMSAVAGCIAALPVPVFPGAAEARWETQNRTVWNEQERASEER